MNRDQLLSVINGLNQLQLDVNKINRQVSSLVIIPEELEKWYHLLNYIRLQPGRMYTILLSEHYVWKKVKWNFSKVYSVAFNEHNQWFAEINDGNIDAKEPILLKNIVKIEPVLSVDESSKRARLTPCPVEVQPIVQPVVNTCLQQDVQVDVEMEQQDNNEENNEKFKFKECLVQPYEHLTPLDVNNLPSHLEMTNEQLQLVNRYLNLLSIFGCPIIRKPTLHEDPDHPTRWFVLFIINQDRGFKWYCPAHEVKKQLEKEEPKEQVVSKLKYKQMNQAVHLCSSKFIQPTCDFFHDLKTKALPKLKWGKIKPMLKVVFYDDTTLLLQMHSLDRFDPFKLPDWLNKPIKFFLTEWDEPINYFSLSFLCHRFVLKYSWSILTGGWMNNTANLGVPSLYYTFKTIFEHGDEASGKFVDSIGDLDYILKAIDFELCDTAPGHERIRLIQICLDLIPLYFENHEDESSYMHNKRIGYTLKQTMTTWFDGLMYLACEYKVIVDMNWTSTFINRLLKIHDIQWMLNNLIIWSESSFHPERKNNWIIHGFSNLDLSLLTTQTHISRDNLALVKRIVANHHNPKDAMLQLANTQAYNYVKRFELMHKAGFDFAQNFEFCRAAYSVLNKDDVYIQFLQSVGAKTITLTLAEIIQVDVQDAQILLLMCDQSTPEIVLMNVYEICAASDRYMTTELEWVCKELATIKPCIASIKVTKHILRKVKCEDFLNYLIHTQHLTTDSSWMKANGVTFVESSQQQNPSQDARWLFQWLLVYISSHSKTDMSLVFHPKNSAIKAVADDAFAYLLEMDEPNIQTDTIQFIKDSFYHFNMFFHCCKHSSDWIQGCKTKSLLQSPAFRPIVEALYADPESRLTLECMYGALDAIFKECM